MKSLQKSCTGREDKPIGPPPPCVYCENLEDISNGWRCKAYPSGIPENILNKGVDHFSPRPGDHGIQFVGDSKSQSAAKQRWLEAAEAVQYFAQRREGT